MRLVGAIVLGIFLAWLLIAVLIPAIGR